MRQLNAARVRSRGRIVHGMLESRVGIHVARLFVIFAIFGIWEYLTRVGYINQLYVGRPSAIFVALIKLLSADTTWTNAASTIAATLISFAVGSALGIAAGLILAASEVVDRIFDPIIIALNSIPRIALAPLFILWFGIGIESKAFAAFTLVFFILLITTRAGLKNADPDLLLMARTHCASKVQTFTTIVIPVSVPSIFAGLRLAAIYSLLGVVVTEMIASQAGLGVILSRYAQTFAINETFAVLIILGVLSSLLVAVVQWVESRVLRWQKE